MGQPVCSGEAGHSPQDRQAPRDKHLKTRLSRQTLRDRQANPHRYADRDHLVHPNRQVRRGLRRCKSYSLRSGLHPGAQRLER